MSRFYLEPCSRSTLFQAYYCAYRHCSACLSPLNVAMEQDKHEEITCIEDVDRMITYALTQWSPQDNPTGAQFWDLSLPYRRLRILKRLYGAHPAVDRSFNKQRDAYFRQRLENTHTPHLQTYETAFASINRANGGCFFGGRVKRFLDLGCSPGGFSSWLLKNNKGVRGVGITLAADEEGGFPFHVDPSLCAKTKYRVRYEDVIQLAMTSVSVDKNPVVPIRDNPSIDTDDQTATYDLIIAGAFFTLQGHIKWWNRAQLTLSQLLLVVSNLAQGGSGIFVVNTKPSLVILDVVGVLRRCFTSVLAQKGGRLHAQRSSCYLVCRGFHASREDLEEITGRVRAALRLLGTVSESLGSNSVTGDSDSEPEMEDDHEALVDRQQLRWFNLRLMSGVSAAEVYDKQQQFVLRLFEPLWTSQFEAIHTNFAQILLKEYGEENKSKEESAPTSPDLKSLGPALPTIPRGTAWHRHSSAAGQRQSGVPTTRNTKPIANNGRLGGTSYGVLGGANSLHRGGAGSSTSRREA
ncbi:hypothetical protein WOLCODRAFT_128005 [Wolfiporia cocos MD-104 SS10]|uniref:Ribosomal RNA methyltransferase FtsJ domain-containing protein n=1 Tax=Wolfiporia cocos (strain MD-104) TaxID=742152 RepID=A0A2H3J472_WOLCO|nr:hypothetical protein WOLCODRAFT_128005 [Wolfiporia cocos MD-104 SS10]